MVSREDFLRVANNSKSLSEMIRYWNLSGSAFYTLKERLIAEGFDLSIFIKANKDRKKKPVWIPKPLEKLMVENSDFSRSSLKRRLIKDKIIPYICAECGCEPYWNGKPLVFVLDHINGIRNDHRKENLRFLCPNCNSQTSTFAGRNNSYRGKRCECGKKISFQSKFCGSCSAKKQTRKVNWPTVEELKKMLLEKPMSKIAEDYEVSDKTVAKWVKLYGLILPPRGYWSKVN